MKIVQSTWVRYHHFDLARELNKRGYLERIFTCLPWWKADKESKEQNIPRELITCNFFYQGLRRVGRKLPFYNASIDGKLAVLETDYFSKWVASKLPDCDTYIGISGSGYHAGKLAISRGSGYIMDRGSTQIRYADRVLNDEYAKWNLKWNRVNPWLIENEENEAETASVITVPSHFVKQSFISQGTPEKKIKVVPYGVSLEEFYATGTPVEDIFSILFVGQFSIRKGAPYLLEAFKNFNHSKKELVVVGSIQEEMKPIIAKYSDQNIRFIGAVPRLEVKKYMSCAHVMVLPSIEEGLALVQAQAMACGCPVIATPNTGSETLFENGKEGLIIEASNSKAISDSFMLLADNPDLRKQMSLASKLKVQGFGGWTQYADNIVEVAKLAKAMKTF